MEIKLLGTRGSLPVADPRYLKYGGDTACVLVTTKERCIILDAGTGLRNFTPSNHGSVDILLSHAHIDHMLGLIMHNPALSASIKTRLHAIPRNGIGAKAQLERLMSDPLWPVSPESFGNSFEFCDILDNKFNIGDVNVRITEGNHPGGALVFRLESGGKSVVYCTDFEHGPGHTERITEFARGCDLLIYDAYYSKAEYPQFMGWGHSTWQMGAEIGNAAGVKKVVMFHHSINRTDDCLAAIEAEFCAKHKNCEFGKTGVTYTI